MSSAFLYLGIVVMWLCVLVPMWLRRDRNTVDPYTGLDGALEAQDSERPGDSPESGGDTLADLSLSRFPASGPDAADHEVTIELGPRSPASREPGAPEALTSSGEPADAAPGTDAGSVLQPERRRRARVMARRRRWLLCGVLLPLASVVTAAVGVLPWWGVAPPAVLLVAYLAVLRVAVAADREHHLMATKARAEQERRQRERDHALELAAQQAEAEIIEFRKPAEPFDQYADRTRRAVGD